MRGGWWGLHPAAPLIHLDANANAVLVDTVRSIDPTSKRDVVGNGFNVGMVPEGMPATAWSFSTRLMVILTDISTASASGILFGALQVGVEVLVLLIL
jgi:hypothetical protein